MKWRVPEFEEDRAAELLEALKDRPVRYEDLVEDDSLEARQILDELKISGEVTRLVVGDHIIYRRPD